MYVNILIFYLKNDSKYICDVKLISRTTCNIENLFFFTETVSLKSERLSSGRGIHKNLTLNENVKRRLKKRRIKDLAGLWELLE